MKKTNYEWKKFETFCKEQTNGNFNVENVPADALDKLIALKNFSKVSVNKMVASTSQTAFFQVFKEAFSVS